METLPGHLQRLPAGRNRQQVEALSHTQRERILLAMGELVSKRGYRGTTVEHIVKRAGVARVTFYENFENREACLLAGFDEAVARTRQRVAAAVAGSDDWTERVRLGLAAFLGLVTEYPAVARACLVESMTAGPAAMERYEQALESFTPCFTPGREYVADPDQLPATLEDSLVGGIVWMVHQRLLRNEIDAIPALLPTMLEFSVISYLGEERAAEIAAEA